MNPLPPLQIDPNPSCWCCQPPASLMDPVTTLPPFSSRYLTGRAPTADPNPRGKHHRRPFKWSRTKLSDADGYSWDLDEYRKHIWQLQKEGKPLPTKIPEMQMMRVVLAHRKRHRRVYGRCSCCWDDYITEWERWKRQEPARLTKEGLVMAREEDWLPGTRGRVEWRRGVRLERVVEAEDVSVGDGKVDEVMGDGYEREEGFSLGQIPVEEPYWVKWKPARRRRVVYTPVESEVDSEVESEVESLTEESVKEEWEWEFVAERRMAGRDDDVRSSISSEWVGVADDVDSQGWDGSQGEWEFCR